MRIFILSLLLIHMSPVLAMEREWVLSADEWARPRDGRGIVSMPVLAKSLQAWEKQSDLNLVIHYPGGEEGILWAKELQDWLVALGVPSSHIQTIPGNSRKDAVTIELRR
ncbi:MAG: hypothetical protein IMF01_02845 [Proteobacteria bacterium]|nr:hypothetical protein [Pseudomonadota bacterium]